MRGYIDLSDYVTIDNIPYDDVLDEIGEDYIRDWLGVQTNPEYDLSDPVVRLAVIVELRRLGYSVESGAA